MTISPTQSATEYDNGVRDQPLLGNGELQAAPQPAIGLPQNLSFSRGGAAAVASRVDLASNAGYVVRDLHQGQGKGLFDGLVALLRLRFETWLEERMKGPILRKLEVRKEVANAQKQAEDAQNALCGSLHDRSRSGQLQQIELNQLNRQRLLSDLAQYALPPSGNSGNSSSTGNGAETAASSSSPFLAATQHISKEQIETLALRAAMRLGQEGQDNEAEAWSEYRAELYEKLPHNVAQEVERRIRELRSLLR